MMTVSTRFACNSPKLRRILGSLVGLSISAISCGATAQEVAVSFSGNLGSAQTDNLGLFGPIGGDLSGKPFSVSYHYDPGKLVLNSNQCEQYGVETWWCAVESGAITTTVTINSIEESLTNIRNPSHAVFTTAGLYVGVAAGGEYGVFIENCQDGTGNLYGPCAGQGWYVDYNTGPNTLANPGYPTNGTNVSLEYFPSGTGDIGETLNGVAGALSFVSPFLLDTKNLGNLDLATLLPNQTTPDSATALVADGTSAAIVLLQVPTMDPVTFTTNNGTTLLPWDQNFLQKSPSQGETTLNDVTPIPIGSLLYAVALLQAPPVRQRPPDVLPPAQVRLTRDL